MINQFAPTIMKNLKLIMVLKNCSHQMILNIHGMSNTMDSVDRLQQLQNFQQHMIPGKHKNAAHTILGGMWAH